MGKKQTGVPLGLVMSPLAEVAPGEYPPPVVNLGDLGPVRCLRCKAYMSPFMTFTDGGLRFLRSTSSTLTTRGRGWTSTRGQNCVSGLMTSWLLRITAGTASHPPHQVSCSLSTCPIP